MEPRVSTRNPTTREDTQPWPRQVLDEQPRPGARTASAWHSATLEGTNTLHACQPVSLERPWGLVSWIDAARRPAGRIDMDSDLRPDTRSQPERYIGRRIATAERVRASPGVRVLPGYVNATALPQYYHSPIQLVASRRLVQYMERGPCWVVRGRSCLCTVRIGACAITERLAPV